MRRLSCAPFLLIVLLGLLVSPGGATLPWDLNSLQRSSYTECLNNIACLNVTVPTTTPAINVTLQQSTSNSNQLNTNLTQYQGSPAGPWNPLDVRPGVGATFACSESGKWNVQVSGYDTSQNWEQQQVPIKAETNNLFVALRQGANQAQVTTATPAGAAQAGLTVRPYSSTDGTNTMPTMDAAARKGFQQITDGTNLANVVAAFNALKVDVSSLGGSVISTVAGGVARVSQVVSSAGADAASNTLGFPYAETATGLLQANATFVFNGTTWDRVRSGGATGITGVAGAAASGAAKSGNPVQVGGVFNTTQPTVTTGQMVEAQSTSRGAAIVATGTDTFNVTVNTALPTGTNILGALTANQSVNVAQVGGVATATGVGVSGTGVQRVVDATNDPCQSSGVTKSSVAVALSATGDAQIIAASGSTTIYVCSFTITISGTTAPAFKFDYGTGVNCATGTTALTGAFGGGSQAATGLSVTSAGGATQFATTASQALCINPSGTAPSIQGVIAYVQQ